MLASPLASTSTARLLYLQPLYFLSLHPHIMVQRKEPGKPQPPSHLISNVVKSHSHASPPSHQQQAAKIKRGSDLNKMMKTMKGNIKEVKSSVAAGEGAAPNYMKHTCSSGAKSSCLSKPHSACTVMKTCSSMKVCPYTYCCLNGHGRHELLPPLKHFLSARRRLIKKQDVNESRSDFFIEIHAKPPGVKGIELTSLEEVDVRIDLPDYDFGSVSESMNPAEEGNRLEITEIKSEACIYEEDDKQANDMEQWNGDNESKIENKEEDADGIMNSELVNSNQHLTEFNYARKSRNGPQYLPVEPEPEAEKVDLKHQVMDERKTAEGWMIDHALQQVVNNLAPARKRKVALLVEAFEIVMPSPECEPPLQHGTSGLAHPRSVQACS